MQLPAEGQNQIKAQLLTCVQNEESLNMRRKLCDVIGELAHSLIDDEGNNAWPEFLQFLFENANSTNIIHKEVALNLFSIVPGVFGNQQQQHLNLIKAMLSSAIMDNSNPNIQALAVKATSSFILLNDNEQNIQKSFAEFLPQFLQVSLS